MAAVSTPTPSHAQAANLEEEAEPNPSKMLQLTLQTNSEGCSQGKQQSIGTLSHAEPRLRIHGFAFAHQFCEKQRTFCKLAGIARGPNREIREVSRVLYPNIPNTLMQSLSNQFIAK